MSSFTQENISVLLIKKIHNIVFKNSKYFAGKFRPKGIEVGIRDVSGNIIHRGALSENIISLMQELIRPKKIQLL